MPEPLCGSCQGTGYVLRVAGGVERATRCECWRSGAPGRRLASAGIPKRYEQCNLENFDTLQNDSLYRAKRIAEEFVLDYLPESGRAGLLFLGPVGRGKTHLAVSILRSLIIDKGVHGLFFDFCDLLKTIQASWNKDSQISEEAVLEPVMSAEVLLLDDLGARRPSLWVQEVLFHILNSRYNADRVSLLTSNHPDIRTEAGASTGQQQDKEEGSLEHQIGVRLRSRLHEMCRTIVMEGEDYRRTFKNAEFRVHR